MKEDPADGVGKVSLPSPWWSPMAAGTSLGWDAPPDPRAVMAVVGVPGEVLQHGVHHPSPAPRGTAKLGLTRPQWHVQPARTEPLSALFWARAAPWALAVTLGWGPAGRAASGRGEGRSAVATVLLSSPGLFFHVDPDISSASLPFFPLKPPNCSPGLALMVYPEGCRDGKGSPPIPGGQGAPRGALGCLAGSHCTSLPQGFAEAPPARSALPAAKPGCKPPRRVGGGAGTPPQHPPPSPQPMALPWSPLCPQGSGCHPAPPALSPASTRHQHPPCCGWERHPWVPMGGAGGQHKATPPPWSRPRHGKDGALPVGCRQLPARPPGVFKPPVGAEQQRGLGCAGWRGWGSCWCWGLPCCWVSTCPG